MSNTTIPAAATGLPKFSREARRTQKCVVPDQQAGGQPAITDIRTADALGNALPRLHALRLAIEAMHAPDGDEANALLWLVFEAIDAVKKIRDDVEARLSSAAA